MKCLIYISFTVLSAFSAVQATSLDSLKEDVRLRPTINNSLSYTKALINNSDDSAAFYANQALSLAENRDSVLFVATKVAGYYYTAGKTDKSMQFLKLPPVGMRNILDSISLEWYFQLGRTLFRGNEKDSAITVFQHCVHVGDSLGLDIKTAESLNYLGNILVDDGNYTLALDYYQKALLIDKKNNKLRGMADRYNNIGRIYLLKEEYKKAIQYFSQSQELNIQLGDQVSIAIGYNNIGYSYKTQQKYDEALVFFRRALTIQYRRNEPCFYIYPMYNIGSVYTAIGVADSAEYYLNNAFSAASNCNDRYILSLALYDLGNLYKSLGKFKMAINNYLAGYDQSVSAGLKNEQRLIAEAIAQVYEKQNKYELANSYLRIYQQLQDELFNKQNIQEIARLEEEYKFSLKEQEAELKRQIAEEKQQAELQYSRWLLITSSLFALSLAVIIGMLYRNYKKKKKALVMLEHLNKELQEKTLQLQEKSYQLAQANEEIVSINESLEGKVKRRSREIEEQKIKIVDYLSYNSHEVRGPLARIIGLLSLFSDSKEDNVRIIQDLQKEASELDRQVKEMNRRLEDEKI